MAGAKLLDITTPFANVQLSGPLLSRWGILGASETFSARLSVRTTQLPCRTVTSDLRGMMGEHDGNESGPPLFEDTEYRLRVRSFVPERTPVVIHRDPTLISSIDSYADDRTCAGPLNFRRNVGLTTFEVRVGNNSVWFTVEVFPAKLDYESDYRAVLLDVSATARGLALEYLRATYRTGATESAPAPTGLEWLTLLRNQISMLEQAIEYLNEHPYRLLRRDVQDVQTFKIRHAEESVRRAIVRGQGHGELVQVGSLGPVRSVIRATLAEESVDTPEHRWLKFNLSLVSSRLSDLRAALANEHARAVQSDRDISRRLHAETSELAQLQVIVDRLRNLPAFNSVSLLPSSDAPSLTMMQRAGYSEAYRALMVLRLGLNLDGDAQELATMDVSELYEAWCYVQVVQVLLSMELGMADYRDLIKVNQTGYRVRLRRGESSSIKLSGAQRTLEVLYNPTFPGLTGGQHPDIVIRFRHTGWPDLVVVLDAKYRVDATAEYQAQYGIPGPPQDAINALHRYRDAIVVDSTLNGFERPVVKGAALFPLSAERATDYPNSNLCRALHTLGIGAIPLLPSNTQYLEEWLKDLVALPPEQLADHGPPFAGYSRQQQNSQPR